MSEAPVVIPDVRLETEPMAPVACNSCGAQTEVRKASWEQTSIQWHSNGSECSERQEAAPTRDVNGTPFIGCQALISSVSRAVEQGSLRVLPLSTE